MKRILMCSIFLTLTASCVVSKDVRLCSKANFYDCTEFSFEIDICYDLQRPVMSFFSPYDRNWFYLYSEMNCKGERLRIYTGIHCQSNLADCDFGNKALSIMGPSSQ